MFATHDAHVHAWGICKPSRDLPQCKAARTFFDEGRQLAGWRANSLTHLWPALVRYVKRERLRRVDYLVGGFRPGDSTTRGTDGLKPVTTFLRGRAAIDLPAVGVNLVYPLAWHDPSLAAELRAMQEHAEDLTGWDAIALVGDPDWTPGIVRLGSIASKFERPLWVHAGEDGFLRDDGRTLLETCTIERISHGIGLLDSPALLSDLVSVGVAFDVCPLSSERLFGLGSASVALTEAILERGGRVLLGSDNPAFTGGLNDALSFVAGHSPLLACALSHTEVAPASEGDHLPDQFGGGPGATGGT